MASPFDMAVPETSCHKANVLVLLEAPGIPLLSPKLSVHDRLRQFWQRNSGICLVILAQFLTVLMNTSVRALEVSGENGQGDISPLQILFTRQIITFVLGAIYMWRVDVPHAPFGQREVRPLLAARAFGGFFGVFGLYYSLKYLPVEEATILTFIAPLISSATCSVFFGQPFPRAQKIAGLTCLLGVVVVAQPFGAHSLIREQPVHSLQRAIGVAFAILGSFGFASAYTTIRLIGKRAHSVISVNYFAIWSVTVSGMMLIVLPEQRFRVLLSQVEIGLLCMIGVLGFTKQVLLTAGLGEKKGSKAMNMVYTQIIFASLLDGIVWGVHPTPSSVVGSAMIVAGAVYASCAQDTVIKSLGVDKETRLEGTSLLREMENASDGLEPFEMKQVHSVHRL